jgi:hypothetical protein
LWFENREYRALTCQELIASISGLKTEVKRSSHMLVTTRKATQHDSAGYRSPRLRRLQNLRSLQRVLYMKTCERLWAQMKASVP